MAPRARFRSVKAFGLCATALLALWMNACSDEESHPPAGAFAAGGRPFVEDRHDDVGGQAGAAGAGGGPSCGDGRIDWETEECDGADLGGLSCQALGYDGGELVCDEACKLDQGPCESTEDCFDANDNDNDGAADCGDDDCKSACENACSAAVVIAGDPMILFGQTDGHAALEAASCSPLVTPGTGPEVAYHFTSALTGKLEAIVTTSAPLTVSVRTDCTQPNSELSCATRHAVVDVSEGESVFVLIDGPSAESVGSYALEVFTRPADVCGDGHRDESEECDDGNVEALDGCDAWCSLESGESEDNGSSATANPYTSPLFARITPAEDVDVFAVDVTEDGSSLVATMNSFGGYECALEDIDGYLRILGQDGTTVLSDDEDGSEGLCPRARVTNVPPGTYYVVAQASSFGWTPSFAYALDVVIDHCGNGQVGVAEECDDGNDVPLDGCDQCALE